MCIYDIHCRCDVAPLELINDSLFSFLPPSPFLQVECVVKEEDKDKEGEAKDKAHYPPIKAGHYLLDRLGLMWKEGGQDKDIQA